MNKTIQYIEEMICAGDLSGALSEIENAPDDETRADIIQLILKNDMQDAKDLLYKIFQAAKQHIKDEFLYADCLILLLAAFSQYKDTKKVAKIIAEAQNLSDDAFSYVLPDLLDELTRRGNKMLIISLSKRCADVKDEQARLVLLANISKALMKAGSKQAQKIASDVLDQLVHAKEIAGKNKMWAALNIAAQIRDTDRVMFFVNKCLDLAKEHNDIDYIVLAAKAAAMIYGDNKDVMKVVIRWVSRETSKLERYFLYEKIATFLVNEGHINVAIEVATKIRAKKRRETALFNVFQEAFWSNENYDAVAILDVLENKEYVDTIIYDVSHKISALNDEGVTSEILSTVKNDEKRESLRRKIEEMISKDSDA